MSGTIVLADLTHTDSSGTSSWTLNLVWNSGQFQAGIWPPPLWDSNYNGPLTGPETAGEKSTAQIPDISGTDWLTITSPAYSS
jgi:hypothetical protein